jgi:hypothetical protein
VALYSGQTFCIYMGCTDIDYCIYDICGFMDGFGFLLWLCVWICVWMCLGMCLSMCLGYVYGYRASILREAWFNKYRGLPLIGARFHHHWDLLASRGPFHHRWDLLLHEAHLNDSPNFSNFSRQKMEKFAPVCSVKQIFLAS